MPIKCASSVKCRSKSSQIWQETIFIFCITCAKHSFNHSQMKSCVIAHKYKSPESAEQMNCSSKLIDLTVNRKEIEDIPRYQYPACHGTKHCKKDKGIYNRSDQTGYRVPPMSQIYDPCAVHFVMKDKEKEHNDPDPLVSILSKKRVRHQKEQRCHH